MAERAGPADTSIPAMLTVLEAAKILGIGRTFAYQLVRTGSWPTPVIRTGRLIRIPSGPLQQMMRTGSVDGGPQAA